MNFQPFHAIIDLNHIFGLFEVTDGIYQVRGYDMTNITFIKGQSGWIIVDPLMSVECSAAARSSGSQDAIAHMTPEMILDYLGILVDTTKVPELTFTANIILPGGNYVLRVKNGVLLYQKGVQEDDADVTWSTNRMGLLSIIQKNPDGVAALITQEGDTTYLAQLMDAVTVMTDYRYFNIIEP